jgi:mevalonate kinase
MITVSAPGKLMLCGEHAAVYGYPCLVTAVSQRLMVSIKKTEDEKIVIDAPQVKNTQFVQSALLRAGEALGIRHTGLSIHTSSQFSSTIGFGSSSAVAVATVFALAQLFHVPFEKKQIFDLAYQSVLDVQKTGSGFDVAAAVYGKTIYYEQFGGIIEPLSLDGAVCIIGFSGEKADTVSVVEDVRKKKEKEPEKVERIFTAITKIVLDAKKEIQEKDWERLGVLMNFNQEYLRDLGVSTEKLEAMIFAAKKAGAYGAKLSGAGGGDCMIALVPEDRRLEVSDAITHAGGHVIDATPNAEGVRIENTTI